MTELIVALDTTDLSQAVKWAEAVRPYAAAVKIGMEFFYRHGASGYNEIAKIGCPIFLDLKLHDIPNTVAGALRALIPLKPWMITLHTMGGSAMMDIARHIADNEFDKPPILLGVTILTSMDSQQMKSVGVGSSLEDQVSRLTKLAIDSKLQGVVCSPWELPSLKAKFGNGLVTVVPGIRPEGTAKGDQSRTMTPKEASRAGAFYIVVGRPITQSQNPSEAAKAIVAELRQ